jgi:hypothetical protein
VDFLGDDEHAVWKFDKQTIASVLQDAVLLCVLRGGI